MLALQIIEPAGVNAVDVKDDWEEFKMPVDSGATETVMGEDMLTCTETKIGAAVKRDVEYGVANGVTILNLGEKTFAFQIAEGAERKITVQICDVNKGLLSVITMVNAGNTVVFSKNESFIEDDSTGERIGINEENGMYVLSMWVRRSSFMKAGQKKLFGGKAMLMSPMMEAEVDKSLSREMDEETPAEKTEEEMKDADEEGRKAMSRRSIEGPRKKER